MFGYRRLRAREKRRYNEDAPDEELEGKRNFNLDEQITAERFHLDKDKYLKQLTGEAITLRYIQKNGFDKPILVKESSGLSLRMPSSTFSVKDVKNCVGSRRTIDVMDVQTQKDVEMSMKDWCKYYESKNRDKLLNVISLEFSHTKLDQLVDSPMIVKLLDWVDLVWPRFLKQSQTESTNTINNMKYPKVQKYCLMSVKGSYTDFHIDFGGTSVWYHVLRGKKVFWMVPPTELNLTFYEEWILSGKQQDVFFGDTVEECFRIELEAGNTFFIPSGWIHAVYTPEDSLVFGGNFLHSYGIEKQLRVSQIEDVTKVPTKFRYPFYTELLWYVLQHYVHCLTGKDYLIKQEEFEKDEKQKSADDETEEEDEEQKRPVGKKRKGRAVRRKGNFRKGKLTPKKVEEDGDKTEVEDTDIEDYEDEDTKPKNNNATTCRMTKNSLLRLQYEVSPIGDTSEKPASTSSPLPPSIPPPTKEARVAALTSSAETNGLSTSEQSKNNSWSLSSTWTNTLDQKEQKKIYLTKYEINGLKCLVKYLSKLTGSKKNLPILIKDSKALIDDTKKMIAAHENDDPDLAITGKPISHLSIASNNTDINQLIGQFFRVKDDFSSTEEEDDHVSEQVGSINQDTSGKKKSIDKIKSNHSSSPASMSPSKTSSSKTQASTTIGTSESPNSSINKHNSPVKKEKIVPPSSATPPPRAPSPPTRPLSYNQYTSKTKNKALNDPLPGSFASLIAATSTERNSFDLSVSDTTTVPLSISLGTDSLSRNSWAKSSTSGSEGSSPGYRKNNELQPSPNKWASLMSSKGDISNKKQHTDKSISSSSNKAPNSPVPPKIPQPKPPTRFISLNQKPQNKEKLEFASTPYNSNAHGPQPRILPNSIVNRPMYPPYPTRYPAPNPMIAQQPPNSPYNRPPHHLEGPTNMQRMVQPPVAGLVSPTKQMSQPPIHQSTLQRKTSDLPIQQSAVAPTEAPKKYQQNQISTSSTLNQKESFSTKFNSVTSISEPSTKQAEGFNSNISSVSVHKELPIKLDHCRDDPRKISNNGFSTQQTADLPTNSDKTDKKTSKQQAKPKAKRAKKSEKKEKDSINVDTSSSEKKDKKPRKSAKSKKIEKNDSSTSTKIDSSSTLNIVAPTTSTNSPVTTNSFIMARPMMNINGMGYPTQFQAINNQATMNQLTRAGFSSFISPFSQQIGIPAVQNLSGARFILAAPQTRPNLALNTNRPITATGARAEPDNTALLSLATTALSTSPQTSSYSQVGQRPNVTQAILVSAPNSSNVYAGQHFFRPVIQPMINTSNGQLSSNATTSRPMALQTNIGHLVLTRLPNQATPRFLLASPMLQQAYQLQHRAPIAHQQAQPQSVGGQTNPISTQPVGIVKNQEAPRSANPSGNEPTYRQPPKKMARTMFIPTSAWNQLQNQNKTPIAFTSNISNNKMNTAIVTPTDSGLLSKPSTIPITSTAKSVDIVVGNKESSSSDASINLNKTLMKNISKASKRPAKARHKRGGHRCQTRRMRCSKCPSCVRSDCGVCDTCKNMSKFGGPGTQKQACLARQCTNPQLPRNVVCEICNIDGFTGSNTDSKSQSTLMECNTCYKIVHPQCFKKKRPELDTVEAVIDTDFVNSWKCPGCVSGKSESPELVDTFDNETDAKSSSVKDLSTITSGISCQQQTIAHSSVQFAGGLPNTSKLSA